MRDPGRRDGGLVVLEQDSLVFSDKGIKPGDLSVTTPSFASGSFGKCVRKIEDLFDGVDFDNRSFALLGNVCDECLAK